ncbi:MAG: hypothetical protein ACRD1U_04545 [Vicinamibacterales bacterium]
MTKPRKNWLEWAVFWTGLVLVGAVAAYLVYAAAVGGNRPPQLAVHIGAIEEVPGGFAVAVEVRNSGDVTAEAVVVEVRSNEGADHERGEVTLAFVPHGSTRRGWVTFPQRPDAGTLRARVLGYEEP